MFKKAIPYICITILIIVILYFVFSSGKNTISLGENSQTTTQTTISESEKEEIFENGVDGKETLQSIGVSVVSYKVDDVEDMYFETDNPKCDKGTAITLLLYSNNISIPLTQIKNVELKTSGGTIIDADVQTYLLNNKKACIVFIKIEDTKLLENLSITIKTFDSKQATVPLPTKEDNEKISLFTTDINNAKQGDLIVISGSPYYILENSLFNSYIFMYNDKYYSEAITGTIMIPLYNTYRYMLSDTNFSPIYFADDGIENNQGVSTSLKINDENLKKEYKNKFKGLYGELISATFRIEVSSPEDTATIQIRDDMISRTYYRVISENDAYLKALS